MNVDTDTPPVQDPVVDKADSTNHPVVNDEKHEGVTDLDFYRNQAYDFNSHQSPQSSKSFFDSSTVSTNKKPHPWLIFITVLPKLHLKAIVFTKS
jgi:hypothetical protein